MTPRLRRLPARSLPGGLFLLHARSLPARALGLALLRDLPSHTALLLPRCRSVHTIGMRFPLDLIWLAPAAAKDAGAGFDSATVVAGDDRAATVADIVRVDRAVRPGRVRWCRGAGAVVEARAGSADAFLAALAEVRGSAWIHR